MVSVLGSFAAEGFAEHVVQIQHAHLGTGHAGNIHGRHAAAAAVAQLKIDLVAPQARRYAQHGAEAFCRFLLAAFSPVQRVNNAVLGI